MKRSGAQTRRESVVDVDDELGRFFASEYSSAVSCSLGHAGTGGGGSLPDGWNKAIQFAIPGPAGWLPITKVTAALRVLGGPPPAPPKPPKNGKMTARDHERVARWQRTTTSWSLYLPCLQAYYSPRPGHGTLVPHKLEIARLSFVCALTPTAAAVSVAWMRRECEDEVVKATAAAELADVESEARMDVANAHDRIARKRLEVFYAFEKHFEAKLDIEGDVRRRWARTPLPSDVASALARLSDTASKSPDKPTRERASQLEANILNEARALIREAKSTYQGERGKIDSNIWREHRRKKQELKAQRDARMRNYETFLSSEASFELPETWSEEKVAVHQNVSDGTWHGAVDARSEID